MDTKKILRYTGKTILWLFTILGMLTMVKAGYDKFEHAEGWTYWFGEFGYPGWFAFVIGGLELVAGLLLLYPKTSSYSAILLVCIMIGAVLTLEITQKSDMSTIDAVIGAIIVLVPLFGHWKTRWRIQTSVAETNSE